MSNQFVKTSPSFYICWFCSTVLAPCSHTHVLCVSTRFLRFKCLIACILCNVDIRMQNFSCHFSYFIMSSSFQNGILLLLLLLLFQSVPWSRSGPSIFLTIALQSLVHKLYTKVIQVNKEDEIKCTCDTCSKMHTKFWSVTEGRYHLGDIRIDERITLVWILSKGERTEWNFFLSNWGPATLLLAPVEGICLLH